MVTMIDASTPPLVRRPKTDVVAGYIGGDTPHVWTEAEWRSFGKTRKLPIFVSDHAVNGETDAWNALHQLWALRVPTNTRVAYDLELLVDVPKVSAFGNLMHWAGYKVWVYGSKSRVFQNPSLDGFWVADYLDSKAPHQAAGFKVRATQYVPDVGGWDFSLVKSWAYRFSRTRWWV